MKTKVCVVGGPIIQWIDPVLQLVPIGRGFLAQAIAEELETEYSFDVERLGNFEGSSLKSFQELEKVFSTPLDAKAIIFLPHLPNILVKTQETKLRVNEGEVASVKVFGATKLIQLVKKQNPTAILIPFKLASTEDSKVDIIRWMLELKVGLVVYSRLGNSKQFWLMDVLGNEVDVTKQDLPKVLGERITRLLSIIRRQSVQVGNQVPKVKYLDKLVEFSRQMQPAFSQIIEKNVATGRWPGNFSFRCTHGFLSSRVNQGFVITARNVSKSGLSQKDFVFVESELNDSKLSFHGAEGIKPSTDAPVHRVIYEKLSWVKAIVHGHMQVEGENVSSKNASLWPCGAENEALEIVNVSPQEKNSLWVVNVTGHGFVVLIGDDDPSSALQQLTKLIFLLIIE